MARVRMTKSALAEQRRRLAAYARALPSLKLKRQQLLLELTAARTEAAEAATAEGLVAAQMAAVPHAADTRVALDALLALRLDATPPLMRLGVLLPQAARAVWSGEPPSPLVVPAWVDAALALVRAAVEARLARAAADARAAVLAEALQKAVQRVNLLEQRLVPEARRDIARISQFLADGERTALARAKLASARRLAQEGARREAGGAAR